MLKWKGYDQLLNLVLDKATEFLRDHDDPLKTTDQTRRLGLIICRGPAEMLVSPTDGTDEIANPFIQPDGTRCRFYLLACSLLGSEQYSDNRRKKARHEQAATAGTAGHMVLLLP
ncbi:sm-like protein LSM7 isoform X2 [Musa acuminata AAA Group]